MLRKVILFYFFFLFYLIVSLSMFDFFFFFFQAEDGIRDAQESRGLGDVYKRQVSTQSTGMTYFLRENPPNRLLKRATRPPSSTWRAPPVQAGWDFGSISSVIVSPSEPQVERVSKVVPSVITTLIVW
eukprot:TRINITY_DN15121_c0_g3_i3.p1 TRINITY_DN15121_c0_g3~~TRINITY_DN15121_c0_g3_i3.p1  ORF type:complete len:128 (+),score=17.83 TRINITY_DN15121_c0_g3_i3:1-384(+)